MLVTSKQFSCYPGQQRNAVGLSEITSCIYASQINSAAFLYQTRIDSVIFFLKSSYKVRKFFTNVSLLNNYSYSSIFPFQSIFKIESFFIVNIFDFSFPVLTKFVGFFFKNDIFAIISSFLQN